MPEEKVLVGDQAPEEKEVKEPETKEPETKDEPKEPETKVYAGKFKSPEELEASYSELQKKLGEQGNRLGETEKERSMLLSHLEQMKAQAPAEQQEEGPDLNAQLAAIAEQVESGDLSIGEGMMQSAAISAQIAQAKTTEGIQQQQQQAVSANSQKTFAETYPDFFDMQKSGALEEIKSQRPGFHDDVSAYFEKKAMDTQAATAAAIEAAKAEAFEAGKAEMAKLAGGDKNTSKVLATPGNNGQNIGRKSGPISKNDLRQSGLAALQRARGG